LRGREDGRGRRQKKMGRDNQPVQTKKASQRLTKTKATSEDNDNDNHNDAGAS
jgi:hypothetical protein